MAYAALDLKHKDVDLNVFLVPKSALARNYTILSPSAEGEDLVYRLEHGKFTIHTYDQMRDIPKDQIQEQMLEEIQTHHLIQVGKKRTCQIGLGMAAVYLATVGMLPDMIPLLDEILVGVGGYVAYKGGSKADKKKKTFVKYKEILPQKIEDVEITINPVLTAMFNKIEGYERSNGDVSIGPSAWADLLGDKKPESLISVAFALDDYFGLDDMLVVKAGEGKKSILPWAKTKDFFELKSDAMGRFGITEGAIDVYLAYYSAMLQKYGKETFESNVKNLAALRPKSRDLVDVRKD